MFARPPYEYLSIHTSPHQVRRLIYSCVTLLYAHGDSIPIYTRMNTLMTYLSSKEGLSRSTPEVCCAGCNTHRRFPWPAGSMVSALAVP